MTDAEVAKRYRALVAACVDLGDPGGGRSLTELETDPPDREFPAWETFVMRTGAVDDPYVIELARSVWEGLGPNEYAVQLRERPRTYRGFLAGRAWRVLVVLGLVVPMVAADEAHDRWGVSWWWLFLPLMVGWLLLVGWLFRLTYRRRQRVGGRELPHL